ncbi:MAG: cupin domain-containing protein [Geminicoccaceae bacterium]
MDFRRPLYACLTGLAMMASVANSPAGSEEIGEIREVTLNQIELQDLAAFPGVSSGFLVGTFDTEGLYAARAVMRDGAVFPAHSHPDMRLTIVLSGTMYLGEGERFDEAALKRFPEGTAAITPAGTHHFMAASDGDVTVLEIGSGPSGTTFLSD